MNGMRLALRVLRVDGRSRTSALLTAAGVAVAAALVLLLVSLPGATAARADRAVWQTPSPSATQGAPSLAMAQTEDNADGRSITRIDVASLTEGPPNVELPAGIPRLPGPGEVLLSPELRQLTEQTSADRLGDRFPGQVVDVLGEDALEFPEQLVAVVGATSASMPAKSVEVAGFASGEGLPDPMMSLLAGVGVVVLIVPSMVLVASAARLTAARRERRLAALRLAGATPGQVVGTVAVETGLAAAVGAVLGLAVYPGARALAMLVPWGGGTWQPDDFTLSAPLLVAVLLGIPALVLAAAVLGLRRVVSEPLGAGSRQTPKPLHWWRLFTLPVAGGVFYFAVSGESAELLLPSLGLLIATAALIGPWVTAAVGGLFVRLWRRPSGLLAGRRLRDDPRGAYRASAGVVLAVFTGSMALTLLPSFEAKAGGGPVFQDSVQYVETSGDRAPDIVEKTDAALARYGSGARAVNVGQVIVRDGDTSYSGYVAPCAQAAELTRIDLAGACSAGPGVYGPAQLSGGLSVSNSHDEPAVPLRPGVTTVSTGPEPASGLRALMIDPSVLPAGFVPEDVVVAVPTAGTGTAEETVRTALVGAAPGSEVQSRGLRLADQQTELGDLRRVTVIGLVTAALLAGCSAAIATAGSVMDRRRTFGALIAAGTPVRTVARALRLEAAMPGVVATAGAGITGVLAAIGLFGTVDEGAPVVTPWVLAPVLVGIGVAVLASMACRPALNRVRAEPLADE